MFRGQPRRVPLITLIYNPQISLGSRKAFPERSLSLCNAFSRPPFETHFHKSHFSIAISPNHQTRASLNSKRLSKMFILTRENSDFFQSDVKNQICRRAKLPPNDLIRFFLYFVGKKNFVCHYDTSIIYSTSH